MTPALLALAVLAPWLLLGAFVASRGDGPRAALPLASLPCAALALAPAGTLEADWMLLGTRLALEPAGRALLLLVGLAWSAAAWYAAARMHERFRGFALFWLATLGGVVLSAVAADVVTFYTGYAVMTLAAYGLVLHERSTAARQAARVYLVLALLGEALLLAGMLVIGAHAGNADLAVVPGALRGTDAAWAAGLLLGGFAVKMGLLPVHVWLPVAHPVAPVAASAILSAVLVKAGLLGSLRLVPQEPFDGPAWSSALALVGLAAAFYGVAAGVCQHKLKVALAYSTVSQMGLLAVGLALMLPTAGERGGPLLALLLFHHGLNKAALFLAAGSGPGASRWRLALLALPALALVGLPLTSGALAKGALKEALAGTPLEPAAGLLGLASFATALLVLRVWALARDERAPGPPVHPAWPLLVGAGVLVPWALAITSHPAAVDAALKADAGALRDALWPPVSALAVAWAWRRWAGTLPAIPPGDVLVPALAAMAALRRAAGQLKLAWQRHPLPRAPALGEHLARWLRRTETALARVPAAGLALLALAGLAGWALA